MTRALAAVVLVVALAACTSSGGSPPGDAGGSSTPSSSSPDSAPSGDTVPTTESPEQLGSEVSAPLINRELAGESIGPLGSTELDIETDDGRVQIGTAEMPEAAAMVPRPDGLVLLIASETADAASYSGEINRTASELADFYRTALSDASLDITEIDEPAPGVIIMRFEGDGSTGELAISETPNAATTVIVAVTRS